MNPKMIHSAPVTRYTHQVWLSASSTASETGSLSIVDPPGGIAFAVIVVASRPRSADADRGCARSARTDADVRPKVEKPQRKLLGVVVHSRSVGRAGAFRRLVRPGATDRRHSCCSAPRGTSAAA